MFTKKDEGYFSKTRRIIKARKILGLGSVIEFTEADVRRQFAKLAKKSHPDTSNNPNETVDLSRLRNAKDTLIAYLKDEELI